MAALCVVVYAKDASHLAQFYAEVLRLTREEEGPSFVLLAARGIELTIVQAPQEIAATIELTHPPQIREATPIKFSCLVDDIEATRSTIVGRGGGLKPFDAGWSWRGALHLDGWDPEGNVFQLRQVAR